MQRGVDAISFGAGALTAGIGGTVTFNLATISDAMGILAAGAGVVLTVCTLYWRGKEHRKRMKEGEDDEDSR